MYVADTGNHRVVKLAAGSSTQTVLPFTGLRYPFSVAVDTADNVYVADTYNARLVKLAAGSSAQTVLPSNGWGTPNSVAVDNAGTVYTESRQKRVSPEQLWLRRPAGRVSKLDED